MRVHFVNIQFFVVTKKMVMRNLTDKTKIYSAMQTERMRERHTYSLQTDRQTHRQTETTTLFHWQ